ncbi:hypothetical protein [Bacillus massiliigorillae]|uniref:hypothetical protein n=1 Tax=Bacillus massiliigorillae TaxID=1243664 RepID=UPI0003A374ED|nr:hypothetical protein [Bacillus massiliigorillae]
MNKLIYWIIWTLVVITINIGAFPIALFSLFATQEGTSIFSIDYLIAFSIILVANVLSIQLFIAARRQNQKRFIIGLVAAVIQVIAIMLFMNTSFTASIPLAGLSVLTGIVLLVRSIIKKD